MEPLTALSTALSTIKSLRDLMKSDKPSMGELRETLIQLQETVLSAQEREAALVEDNRRLEVELTRLREWKQELSNYRLENVGFGAAAYVHQPSKRDPKTTHWLCQLCADAGRKAVLQHTLRMGVGMFKCPSCGSVVRAEGEALTAFSKERSRR